MVVLISYIYVAMTVASYIKGALELSLSTATATEHVGEGHVCIEDLYAMVGRVSNEQFTRGMDCNVIWPVELELPNSLLSQSPHKPSLLCEDLESMVVTITHKEVAIMGEGYAGSYRPRIR